MINGKKFVSPGCWFSMIYPADWSEFEDEADSFLFYNPDQWSGNFRISAFREDEKSPSYATFGEEACEGELHANPSARKVVVGEFPCAYSTESFEEEGRNYVTHVWITGKGDTSFECSFTTTADGDIQIAKEIISSLAVRHANEKYPSERIPVRLSEIYLINEAYKWTADLVKQQLTVDFQGLESDLDNLQKAIDKMQLSAKKHDSWMNIGIALCCILSNEIDGLEWNTLIDGNRETPVLTSDDKVIDPMKLVWSKVKKQEFVSVSQSYEEAVMLLSEK